METNSQHGYREKFVCRTCLKIVAGPSFKIEEICDKDEKNGTKISEVLGFIVPELYLGLSVSPEICRECKESVRITYSFRRRCLETENLIGSYLKNAKCTARTIDLFNVLAYSANTGEIDQQTVLNILSEWEDDSSRDNARESENESVEEVVKKKVEKKCFVPTCPVSSENSNKLLIGVPKSEKARSIWSAAVGLIRIPSTNSNVFCCEDHFNMEEDAENWMDYKMMNVKLRMKKHIKPHLNLNRRSMYDDKYSYSQLSPASPRRRLESAKSSDPNVNSTEKQSSEIAEGRFSETIVVSDGENSTENMIHHRLDSNQKIPKFIKILSNGRHFYANRKYRTIENDVSSKTNSGDEKEGVDVESRSDDLEELEETDQLKGIILPAGMDVGEQLTICDETGLFKNKEGKYFSDALKPIAKRDVEALKAKAKTCDASSARYICEETGLLRNSKGEYFTEDGKLLGSREVEAEKEKAKIRGEHLFQISDICTIEEMTERIDGATEKSAISQVEAPKLQSPAETSQKLTATVQPPENEDSSSNPTVSPAMQSKFIKILPKKPSPVESSKCKNKSANAIVSPVPKYIQKLPNVVESAGRKTKSFNLTVPPHIPIIIQKLQPTPESGACKNKGSRPVVSSHLPIPSENLLKPLPSESLLKQSLLVDAPQTEIELPQPSASLLKLSDFVQSVRSVDKSPLNPSPLIDASQCTTEVELPPASASLLKLNDFIKSCRPVDRSLPKPSRLVDPSQCPTELELPPPSASFLKLSDFVKSSRPVDKSPNEHNMPEGVVIKKEPVDMQIDEGQIVFNYFPDDDDDDEETLTASESASYHSLEGLLDSLDASESTQYVDVPEFVQINHFTLNDLENLKRQRRFTREVVSGVPGSDQARHKDINLRALLATQPVITSPERFNAAVRRELLVGSPQENFDGVPNLQVAEPPQTIGSDEQDELRNEKLKKFPLQRYWKKAGPKPRRRRIKIAPVNEDQLVDNGENNNVKSHHPNRELCVLFTNYSYDGLYINDHDYLVTPYKRNNIVTRENGQSFCMCFICGCKHKIEEHVLHMNSHKSKCDICDVNLGTGYMLNLHMRSHTKPCKFCTDLVPYPEINEHAKKHLEEDLEFEKGKERKRKKRDDKDAKPVYFQLSPDPRRTSTSPRLRSRTSRLPSMGTDCMAKKIFDEMNVDNDEKTETDRVDTRNVKRNEDEANNSNASNKDEERIGKEPTETTNEEETNKSNTSDSSERRNKKGTTDINEDETNDANKSDVGERHLRKGRRSRKGRTDINEDDTNNATANDAEDRHMKKGRHIKKKTTDINEDDTNIANVSNADDTHMKKGRHIKKVPTDIDERDSGDANTIDSGEWHIKKEAINVEAKEDETNNVETSNSDVKHIEKEANEDKTDNSNTSKVDAWHVEKESADSKIPSPSKRKVRKRKIETLSKEECDLEEKLVKIDEISKESKNKRVLRSSFGKKPQGCGEKEESASHNEKQEPPLQ